MCQVYNFIEILNVFHAGWLSVGLFKHLPGKLDNVSNQLQDVIEYQEKKIVREFLKIMEKSVEVIEV